MSLLSIAPLSAEAAAEIGIRINLTISARSCHKFESNGFSISPLSIFASLIDKVLISSSDTESSFVKFNETDMKLFACLTTFPIPLKTSLSSETAVIFEGFLEGFSAISISTTCFFFLIPQNRNSRSV